MKKFLLSGLSLLPLLFLTPGAHAESYSYDCLCLYSDPRGTCREYTCDAYRNDRRSYYNNGYSNCNNRRYNYNDCSNSTYRSRYWNSSSQYYGNSNDYNWYYNRYNSRSNYYNYPSYNDDYNYPYYY
ncbi:MAG: hypothetical protein PHO20_01565 [Candidatus Peribacteraceae bacterium]|nr:hypothetical protein [Candidatus Peribacteraceae bacterium]MDD5739436.1 hypothetical protein [Candidatus Peribacteraceae bacterium]